MNAQELLETYGKAATVVKAYYLEKFLESMNTTDVPENFKEFAKDKGIDNDTVAKMIELAPRTLFDVFDAYEVYIEILVDYTADAKFTYGVIDGDEMNTESTIYNSRIEAEKVAIEKAFEVLNKNL
jgi:hypothetical protein